MVSAVRSVIYHADSSDMWRHILRKGGNVRKEQGKCEEKSSEITAIPKLLELLEIKECIATIDAMGTQTEIAKKITEKGADYILSLKENQKTLYGEYRTNPAGISPDCHAGSHSQGHGRYESRTRYVCEDIGWLEGCEKWSGLAGIGVISCNVEQGGKVSKQAHYFLYSRKGMTASQALEAKRSHWSIENQLHWVSESSVLGSFSDKQFKCLLDEAFLDKIVYPALCS